MGRKTFESLGKILPNRKHIIFTRNRNFRIDSEDVKVVYDISDIKEYIENDEENFVIGGEAIYKMLMPYSKIMYVTKIEEEFEADTFFPEIKEEEWKIISTEKRKN